MNVLYVAASGKADPVRAALPLHLAANGSAAVGQSAEIVLAGDATDLLTGDTLDTLEPLGTPPMRELAAKVLAAGITVHV